MLVPANGEERAEPTWQLIVRQLDFGHSSSGGSAWRLGKHVPAGISRCRRRGATAFNSGGAGSHNVQPAPQRGSYVGSPKPKGPKSSLEPIRKVHGHGAACGR